MANTLAAIMPKILARSLSVLRERAVMPRLVNSSYSQEAAQKGDTIDVPIPTAVGTMDVVPSSVPPIPTDFAARKVQIPLDQWRQTNPFHLTDKDLVEIDRNKHYLPMQVGEAIRSLASFVNKTIIDDYKRIYTAVGDPTQIPFGVNGVKDATAARKALSINLAPRDNRRGVIDFEAEASALALSEFSDANKIMSANVRIEGEIGRKYGIDWIADDDVPTHITGAAPLVGGIAVANAAGYAADPTALTSAIHVDGHTADPAPGDVFTFAGHAQQYVVRSIANSTIIGAGPTFQSDLVVSPGLKAAVVDNEAMTFVASHKVNLVFHRDAFAFATRPLVSATMDVSFGSEIISMQDPQTGLVIRLEASRQHKQVVWEFDILFGRRLIRPELATRLMGSI